MAPRGEGPELTSERAQYEISERTRAINHGGTRLRRGTDPTLSRGGRAVARVHRAGQVQHRAERRRPTHHPTRLAGHSPGQRIVDRWYAMFRPSPVPTSDALTAGDRSFWQGG